MLCYSNGTDNNHRLGGSRDRRPNLSHEKANVLNIGKLGYSTTCEGHHALVCHLAGIWHVWREPAFRLWWPHVCLTDLSFWQLTSLWWSLTTGHQECSTDIACDRLTTVCHQPWGWSMWQLCEDSTEYTCISSALYVNLDRVVSRRCQAFQLLMKLCQFDTEFLVSNSRWNIGRRWNLGRCQGKWNDWQTRPARWQYQLECRKYWFNTMKTSNLSTRNNNECYQSLAETFCQSLALAQLWCISTANVVWSYR